MRVLSIQSHVVFGHVGNAAAVFALQRLGIDALPLMTVQFSNHTGYPTWHGTVLPPQHVTDIVDGLDAIGQLAPCDAVLSGYVGNAETGHAVIDAARRVKTANPDALYACDPVMGDTGKGLFVGEDVAGVFREEALRLADILTPNVFELGLLTESRPERLDEVVAAARHLIAGSRRLVLVTSVRGEAPGEIAMVLVSRAEAYIAATPFIEFPVAPNGAGDLAAALFLGNRLMTKTPAEALEATTASLYGVLEATRREGTRELALIEAQDELAAPTRRLEARPLEPA